MPAMKPVAKPREKTTAAASTTAVTSGLLIRRPSVVSCSESRIGSAAAPAPLRRCSAALVCTALGGVRSVKNPDCFDF